MLFFSNILYIKHLRKESMPTISCQTRWKKSTAICMAALFLLEAAVWAAPVSMHEVFQNPAQDSVRIQSQINTMRIPAELGSIQRQFISPSPGAVVLIHIEDAHGEPEAQKNTQAILEHLQKAYGVQTFFLEGAWSRLDASRLKILEDASANQKILEQLTEKGIVGGPENFLYENSKKVQGFGIETLDLYKKNLKQFRAVMNAKPESDLYLNQMKAVLLTKASQTFNPELAAYFRQWSFQEEIQTDYAAHIRMLSQVALKNIKVDLNDPREQYDFPMLVRFMQLKGFEKNGNAEAKSREEQKLKTWLLRHKLILPPVTRENFENFYEKAIAFGFSFSGYPELSREWGKQILSQELQAPQLLEEIQKLEDQLLEKLAQTPEEKKVIQKYREYLLLKKLLHLELSQKDWQQFQTQDQGLKTEDLSLLRRESLALQKQGQESLIGVMHQAQAFYETAEVRDQAMALVG